jgi:hypothetical protein
LPLEIADGAKQPGSSVQQKRPAQARVYTLTPVDEENKEEENNNVVSGTLSLFSTLACTLFDSGATHSFISASYVKLCHIKTQSIGLSLAVETPGGEKIKCSRAVINCPVKIDGKILPANLAEFKGLGYDIILGMDWLSKYYASIDCRRKEVIFNIPGVEEFKFYGSRVRATPPILSSIQAKRSIRQGALAYLAYVSAKPEVEKKLEDIPVVCDYPDVFAEVQSGLPPDREIEFTIDLMPGTEPGNPRTVG